MLGGFLTVYLTRIQYWTLPTRNGIGHYCYFMQITWRGCHKYINNIANFRFRATPNQNLNDNRHNEISPGRRRGRLCKLQYCTISIFKPIIIPLPMNSLTQFALLIILIPFYLQTFTRGLPLIPQSQSLIFSGSFRIITNDSSVFIVIKTIERNSVSLSYLTNWKRYSDN